MSKPFIARVQVTGDHWLEFRDPVLVLQADAPDAVHRTLVDVEQLTRDRGLHAVGFVTYEAGAAFGLPVSVEAGTLPLAWFALCEPANVLRVGHHRRTAEYRIGTLTPSVDRGQFAEAFDRIRQHLADGNTYQANYTFRMSGSFGGDAASFFADLCDVQRGGHAAFIDLGRFAICSASPELFFEIQGLDIVARPMKGTARRGRTFGEDRAAGEALAASPKNQAENVMVVDMVRNDLGRIAEVGSVDVSELFTVERYPNVWQMTSLVKARSLAPLADIFAALHPSASVTGAPKRATMALLQELEAGPRGVYTGAIGHVPPDGLASFNVAIRTAVVDRSRSTLSFGIGSGIVWDSESDDEYEECLLKGSVLGQRPVEFDLLETLLWTPLDGFFLLDRHLHRLGQAAEYFSVPMQVAEVRAGLTAAVANAHEPLRLRLLVSRDGRVRV
ncbi:MAG: chorismate-binding protein, partial [Vicinamibacterales bacterium]